MDKTSKIISEGFYTAPHVIEKKWEQQFTCKQCGTVFISQFEDLRKYNCIISNYGDLEGKRVIVKCPLLKCPGVEFLAEKLQGSKWRLSSCMNNISEVMIRNITTINPVELNNAIPTKHY